MKKLLITSLLALILTTSLATATQAVSLVVNDVPVRENVLLYNSTTYIPLRTTSTLLDSEAQVGWSNGGATVTTNSLNISARPGETQMWANGKQLYAPHGIMLVKGVTLVPVRLLADAFGATVHWDSEKNLAILTSEDDSNTGGYDADSLYWLSRIIHAESSGESMNGKIGVGNVIINRVHSSEYPDTIYGVIFDTKHGTQFSPVINGAIYNNPAEDSITAAKRVLDGENVVGSSLYFFNPAIAESNWISANRPYVMTIGNHAFYG